MYKIPTTYKVIKPLIGAMPRNTWIIDGNRLSRSDGLEKTWLFDKETISLKGDETGKYIYLYSDTELYPAEPTSLSSIYFIDKDEVYPADDFYDTRTWKFSNGIFHPKYDYNETDKWTYNPDIPIAIVAFTILHLAGMGI